MAEESGMSILEQAAMNRMPSSKAETTYVKSPVASLCFTCSSVRKRVRVTISVLIFSCWTEGFAPLDAMAAVVIVVVLVDE